MSGTIGSVAEEDLPSRSSRPIYRNKRKSNNVKHKSLKKLEEDLLNGLFSDRLHERYHNHSIELHDSDDECTTDSADGEELDFPCKLDFYNFKRGKISRKGKRKHVTLVFKEKSNASFLKGIIENKDVNPDGKMSIHVKLCNFKNHKVRTRIYLIKREVKKAAKRMSESELKAKNIELRLHFNDIAPLPVSPGRPGNGIIHQHHHVLRRDNGDKFKSETLLSQLINIQDREITPEDFDLLLQLDTFVEVKTVPKSVIDNLRTEHIDKKSDSPCMICMEDYELGQLIMYLECNHFFHSRCIRTWLTVNSTKCPLDGLEVC